MNLTTEQPLWYLIFCLLFGALLSGILYFRDKSFGELSSTVLKGMAALRFVFISLLCFLLLTPLIKTLTREIEKPIVLIGLDNSRSLSLARDSVFYRNEMLDAFDRLAEELEERYEVRRISYGAQINELNTFKDIDYSGKQTDLSAFFEDANDRLSNRNVGAVILAGDGLYNVGSNPLQAANKLKAPIYTVALGDTGIYKDLILGNIRHNATAFLGNNFPIEITVDARKCSGSKTILTVLKDSVAVFTRAIDLSGNSFQTKVSVLLDAKPVGMQRYTVALSEVKDELTLLNNSKDIYVEVLAKKQKILILAASPHPDLSAIKQSIESSENYSVQFSLLDKFNANFREFNLIILHQIPSTLSTNQALMEDVMKSEIPLWFILGTQTSVEQFNSLQSLLNISQSSKRSNEVLANAVEEFSYFNLKPETQQFLKTLSPLSAPFGTYRLGSDVQVMLKQQIGQVKTNNPLWLYGNIGEKRIGILTGEGIWKWKLQEYSNKENHLGFDEIIIKSVQYLASKETNDPFKVRASKTYNEYEAILFDAELRNESGEMVKDAEIRLSIINQEKKSFPFTFTQLGKSYALNAGFFAPGKYKYEARTSVGTKPYILSGEFTVREMQAEFTETIADHSLLNLLASRNDGKMMWKDEISKIKDLLFAREDVKPIVYNQEKLSELIHLKWVFFLLLFFVSMEWFLRKRNGSY